LAASLNEAKKAFSFSAPMIGKKGKEEEGPADADTKSNGESRLYGFRAVYVFDRLSRDLWPSLCALDVIRQCHFRKFSSIAASTSSLNSSVLRNTP
jgi:hypothetical protein